MACNSDFQPIDWSKEARAVIDDVRPHLAEAHLSETLGWSPFDVFINIKTLEDRCFTIRLSPIGFQIVGNSWNCNTDFSSEESFAYETIYALLGDLSPKYTESFGEKLLHALERLN